MFYFFELSLPMQATNSLVSTKINDLAVGIISGILTYLLIWIITFIYKEKKPLYFIKSFNVINDEDIDDKFEKLKIEYNGQIIKNLTVTKIAFWNAGKDTIEDSDIVSLEPIRIEISLPYQILDAKVICVTNNKNKENNNINGFKIHPEDKDSHKQKRINFEFLDRYQGGVIKVIHTSKSIEGIKFLGRIKKFGKPKNADRRIETTLIALLTFVGYLIILYALIIAISFILNTNILASNIGVIIFTMMLLVIFSGWIFICIHPLRKRYFDRLFLSIPKDLYDNLNDNY